MTIQQDVSTIQDASPIQDVPPIAPRHMNFQFDPNMPRYWFDNDQFKTLLFTALSCMFPDGERFFIQSVRRFQDGIDDPQLRQQVRGFIGQEAQHGKEHHAFNDFMRSKGLQVGVVEIAVKKGMAFLTRWLSPERQLAKTCALEHFTAILAELLLEHPDVLDGMDPTMESLWLWHAIEESEHKAVAFDVYQHQVGRYGLRISEMVISTVEFMLMTTVYYIRLRRASGLKTDWRSVRQGLRWLAGRDGYLRRLRGRYRAYYRRDFHPGQRNCSALHQSSLQRLTSLQQRPALAQAVA